MNRYAHDKRKRDRSFDRRLDQLIETGRQVVDGVSGNRPGKRYQTYLEGKPLSSLNNVGRWVEDKLEWLLEDDEDWMEEPVQAKTRSNYSGSKKPLEAVSRRIIKKEGEDIFEIKSNPTDMDKWPDDETFRLDKWKRIESRNQDISSQESKGINNTLKISSRPLPRSSRKRVD